MMQRSRRAVRRGRQQNVELPDDLRRAIRAEAARRRITLRQMYELLLRQALRRTRCDDAA